MSTSESKQTFGEQYFDIRYSTLKAVILSILTCGFYLYYIFIRMAIDINKYYNDKKIDMKFVFIWIIINNLLPVISQLSIDAGDYALTMFITVLSLCSSVAFCFYLYIIFSKNIESMLIDNNLYSKVHGILFIFAVFYPYYIIYNAEKRHQNNNQPKELKKCDEKDSVTKLEKLAELKNSGVLTEEEFNEQKIKILQNN